MPASRLTVHTGASTKTLADSDSGLSAVEGLAWLANVDLEAGARSKVIVATRRLAVGYVGDTTVDVRTAFDDLETDYQYQYTAYMRVQRTRILRAGSSIARRPAAAQAVAPPVDTKRGEYTFDRERMKSTHRQRR